ncbi:hypothetical protein [Formosa sp. A9]
MQHDDLNKHSPKQDSEDKQLEDFLKNRENQTSALKKILEKFIKKN